MKKIILLTSLISFNARAIDLESKIKNTDKGLFETIPDNQTLEKGKMNSSVSFYYTSKPLIEVDQNKNEKILIGNLLTTEFASIYGLSNKFEVGLLIPFQKTINVSSSVGQDSFSTGDLYLEAKYNLFEGLALVPNLILPTGSESSFTGTKSGGYGIRTVGSLERINFPLFFSLGIIKTPNSTYKTIDHSKRLQFGFGSMTQLSNSLILSAEIYGDKTENNFPIETIAHVTYLKNNYSIRFGIGSGFLSNDSSNEYKVLGSFVYSFDFNNKKETSKIDPEIEKNTQEILDKLNKVETLREEEIQPKKTKETIKKEEEENIKKMMINRSPSSIEDDSVKEQNNKISKDKYNVLPIYTHKDKVDLEKKGRLDKNLIKLNADLKKLEMNIGLFQKNNDKNLLVELNWGLRVIEKRKNVIKEIINEIEDKDDIDFVKFLKDFEDIKEAEIMARNILNEEKSAFKEIVKKEREKNTISVQVSESTIKENQIKAWKFYKDKTLQDVLKESKTEIIKEEKTEDLSVIKVVEAPKLEILTIKIPKLKAMEPLKFNAENNFKEEKEKILYEIQKIKFQLNLAKKENEVKKMEETASIEKGDNKDGETKKESRVLNFYVIEEEMPKIDIKKEENKVIFDSNVEEYKKFKVEKNTLGEEGYIEKASGPSF